MNFIKFSPDVCRQLFLLIAYVPNNVFQSQAGNNLLIVQSPGGGQPAVVQQVQLVQHKSDQQIVQIPPQALKVVQAASATLPPVPQRQTVMSSVQMSPPEPTQVHQKTTLKKKKLSILN